MSKNELQKQWAKKNRHKVNLYTRNWAKRNPERYKEIKRNATYRYWYKITLEDYNKMFAKQKGYCAICGKHQSKVKFRLAIDHNHKTGKIRGLLCSFCNTSVDWCENNKEKIEDYLKKYKE